MAMIEEFTRYSQNLVFKTKEFIKNQGEKRKHGDTCGDTSVFDPLYMLRLVSTTVRLHV